MVGLSNQSRDFAETLRVTATMEEAEAALSAALSKFPVRNYFYGFACLPDDPNRGMGVVTSTDLPGELMDIYADAGGVTNDPIAERVFQLRGIEAFDAEFARYYGEERFRDHPIFTAYLDDHLDYGCLVPMRSRRGAGSVLCLMEGSNRQSRMQNTNSALVDGLEAIVSLFHEKVHAGGFSADVLGLSVAQLDLLRRVAEGTKLATLADHYSVGERAIEKRL